MDLVRGADPARTIRGGGESREVVVLPLLTRQFDALFVHLAMSDRQHGVQHLGPELVADALLEHVTRVPVAYTVLDHVVQDSRDDRLLIPIVPRKDDRYVRRVREIRKPRTLAHLSVVVLRGEGEGMVDPIGVAARRHYVSILPGIGQRWDEAARYCSRTDFVQHRIHSTVAHREIWLASSRSSSASAMP